MEVKTERPPSPKKRTVSGSVRTTDEAVTKVRPADKKKKLTQAAWDKWVKQSIVSVSPDVWGTHASDMSHASQLLTDVKRIPTRVLLDTPTLDYLVRCPSCLSHNALLVVNDDEVECLVSWASVREWADKMRSGHYMLRKEDGFFEKILLRFELESVDSTAEVVQKYLSLKSPSFVDISWERKPEELVSTRLDADERPTRLIASHALVLGIPIISPDLRYGAYRKEGLKTIW